ncbi:MAG: helix-turn-helix domain-containing protein, partial [Nitrospirota bacterium]
MSADEHETVSLGLAHGHSLRALARLLGRTPSTVSRARWPATRRGATVSGLTAHTVASSLACQPRRSRKLL